LQNGVVYLITPTGNPNYIETALSDATKWFGIWQKAIQNQLEDLQTRWLYSQNASSHQSPTY
jgi:hypothetical protein